MSEAKVSQLISLFILPMAIITPLIGFAAGRISIKPVLVASLCTYACGGLICFCAADFDTVLWGRILQGIGAAGLELFGLIMLIENVPSKDLYLAIGKNAAVIGIATAVAPVVSGVVAEVSWRATFLFALASLPMVCFVIAVYTPRRSQARTIKNGMKQLLFSRKAVLGLGLIFVVFYFLFGVLLAFVPAIATEEGITSSLTISILPAITAVAIGITAYGSTQLSKMIGSKQVIQLSLISYVVSMLLCVVSLKQSFFYLPFGCLMLGVGHGLLFPLAQALFADIALETGEILIISANITAIGISQTIAPVLTSWIDSLIGLESIFIVSGCAAVILWLVVQVYPLAFKRNFN